MRISSSSRAVTSSVASSASFSSGASASSVSSTLSLPTGNSMTSSFLRAGNHRLAAVARQQIYSPFTPLGASPPSRIPIQTSSPSSLLCEGGCQSSQAAATKGSPRSIDSLKQWEPHIVVGMMPPAPLPAPPMPPPASSPLPTPASPPPVGLPKPKWKLWGMRAVDVLLFPVRITVRALRHVWGLTKGFFGRVCRFVFGRPLWTPDA